MIRQTEVYPMASIDVGSDLYFSDLCSNSLYVMKEGKGKAELVIQFEEECSFKRRLYTGLILGENKIFGVPHGASTMGIYDLNCGEGKSVELPRKIHDVLSKFKVGAYNSGHIYLLGYCVENVWDYDIDKDEWFEIEIPQSNGLFMSSYFFDNYLYIVSKASPNIWRINSIDRSVETITIDIKEVGYVNICVLDKYMLLTSYQSGKVYSLADNIITNVWSTNSSFLTWPHGGATIGADGNYYQVSLELEGLTKIDIKDGKMGEIAFPNSSQKNRPCIINALNEYIYVHFYESSEGIKYNVFTSEIESFNYTTDIKPIITYKNGEKILIEESPSLDLDSFLESMNIING